MSSETISIRSHHGSKSAVEKAAQVIFTERPGQRPGQHLDQDLLGHLQGGGGPGL